MKKIEKAKEIALLGLEGVNNYSDFYIANQLNEILQYGTISTLQSKPIPSPPSLPTTSSTTSSSQITSIPTTTQQQQQQQGQELSNEIQKTKTLIEFKKSTNSLNIKGETLTIEQLTQLRDHFISNDTHEEANLTGKVHYSYISAARQNLSYATNVDVIDDLIAFGYLIVNSNRLKEAFDLFQVLLAYK